MKSKRYLAAVLALPVLGGTAVAATTVGPARPVEVAAGASVNPAAEGNAAPADAAAANKTDEETDPPTDPDVDDETADKADAKADEKADDADPKADDEKADDEKADGEKADDEKADDADPKADDENTDDEKADDKNTKEEKADDESTEAEAYDAFWDAGYSFEQLTALADYWDLDQFGAKAKAGSLILDGDQGFVDAALADIGTIAPAPTTPPAGDWNPDADDLDAFAAYWEAGYGYNQLLALADYWDLSEFDAKVKAGTLVLGGRTGDLDSILADAGVTEPDVYPEIPQSDLVAADAFFGAGYSYEQAVALGEVWGLDSWDAKIKAGTFVISGQQAERVDAVLASIG